MNALDVSKYFIELANDESEHDLTNLKLQKLLYYAQGKHQIAHGAPLFTDSIEAWRYGPVVSDVYHALKQCGSFPVTVFDIDLDHAPLDDDTKATVTNVWESIGKVYSGGYLVDKTHVAGAPWQLFYREGENVEIPNESIATYLRGHKL